MSRRVTADPERLERGLAHLVLTIIELLRQLMERQALHRIEGGSQVAIAPEPPAAIEHERA